MQVNASLSQSLIAVNQPTTVDLVLGFQAPAQTGDQPRIPLNLSLVLDRSASMGGRPLKYAIAAAQALVNFLTPEDYLSVVVYDDTTQTILAPQRVTDPKAIQKQIGRIRAGGLTNLSGGWMQGCDFVKANQTEDSLNRVLLLTDGIANRGITNHSVLVETAREQAEAGIITTTLGFGNNFVEDLLIEMANAAGGNFYYIQSPDDAEEVFRIELESLVAVVAQNLSVTITPDAAVQRIHLLNNYRRQQQEKTLHVFLGDVYATEPKPLLLEFELGAIANPGEQHLAILSYGYQQVVDGAIQLKQGELPITIQADSAEAAAAAQPDPAIQQQTSLLRMARAKDEALGLADQEDYQNAAQILRQIVERIQAKELELSFDVAEELEHLLFYADRLEQRRFDRATRKEMRDQSHQARTRSRADLSARSTTSGSTEGLDVVKTAEDGVLVECRRSGGKLRVRAVSEGYDPDLNVQFPRAIREEGVTYLVDELQSASNGSFYRAVGTIKVYDPTGQHRSRAAAGRSSRSTAKLSAAKVSVSLDELETTDTVGEGILIQCVNDGKKLRARVVSDGYDPDYNVRFPRSVRKEGVLFVVDAVKESGQGGSYITLGKVKRLVQ
ncbi:MAG: VWA domain-containing protein [Cyanobacteria bacterium P01_G01_bin.54]